jgi:WD40 repeat protein
MLTPILPLLLLAAQPKLVMSAELGEAPTLVKFSPDGKRLVAVTASTGKAVLYDVRTGKVITQAKVPGRGMGAAYLFDKKRLVTGQSTLRASAQVPTLQSVSFPGGGHARMIDAPGGWPVFANRGDLFVLSTQNGPAQVMSMMTLANVGHLSSPVKALGVDNGGRAAAIYTGRDVALISWPDGKVIRSISRPNVQSAGVAVDMGSRSIVFAAGETLEILNADNGTTRRLLKDIAPTGAIAFSPDGSMVWVGNMYGRAFVVDVKFGTTLFTGFSRELGSIYPTRAVDWSSNGRFIAAGYYTGEVKVWDVSRIRGR